MEKPFLSLRDLRRSFVIPVCAVVVTVHSLEAQSPLPVRLQVPARGTAAINALGNHLPAVARAYGLSPQRLAGFLQTQPSLGVDRDGLLLFACEAPGLRPRAGSAGIPAPGMTASAPAIEAGALNPESADTLRLHSFPGAPRVIYLDFNGHTTSGTPWNTNMTGGAPIVSQPFDLDGSPDNFNAAELELIRRMWRRVAEDFAPFAVDVTTEDPGIEALRRTTLDDANHGVRAVISPTNWYGSGAGVGYVGSFNWNSDTPCFIFTQQLANSEKYIAECVSHEAGHTLGLYHDGTNGSSPTEYYLGHGDWAPIMGAGYYRAVTQFSRGEYANANRDQDDLGVIASFVPYAGDDHGDTPATSTLLNGSSIADGGTIEHSADLDVFRFTTGSGAVSFHVQGPAPEPNLDLKAELLDGNGQALQGSNPAWLDASLNTTLAAGTYYLRISAVGAGDPATTGYSSYGSVGNYVITGTLPTATPANQPPVAVASASVSSGAAPLAVVFSSAGSTDPDGTIVGYHWDFGNGASSTAATPAYTYSSPGAFTATLTVTDNGALTHSASVIINVGSSGGDVAPTITMQPVSQTAPPGETITFTVGATGTPMPTVQWYRDGQTWSSWTGSTLTLYGVSSNDNGTYTAVVSNSAGLATSAPATLTVTSSSATSVAPVITTHPVSQTVGAGENVTFSGAASGSPVPAYQWNKDGVPLAGATGATLELITVTTAQAGNYTLVATNTAGSATSGVAVLTVNTPTGDVAPTITTQPQSQTTSPGSTVIFTIATTGTPAPTIQWYRNGLTWSSWTGSSLVLYGVTSNDVGNYTALVSNSAGSVTSEPATLSVR